jgi:hypothetical protein
MCGLIRTLGSLRGLIAREALRIGDVEGGPDPTGSELLDQRCGLDRAAAACVHQERAVRGPTDELPVVHRLIFRTCCKE